MLISGGSEESILRQKDLLAVCVPLVELLFFQGMHLDGDLRRWVR